VDVDVVVRTSSGDFIGRCGRIVVDVVDVVEVVVSLMALILALDGSPGGGDIRHPESNAKAMSAHAILIVRD